MYNVILEIMLQHETYIMLYVNTKNDKAKNVLKLR